MNFIRFHMWILIDWLIFSFSLIYLPNLPTYDYTIVSLSRLVPQSSPIPCMHASIHHIRMQKKIRFLLWSMWISGFFRISPFIHLLCYVHFHARSPFCFNMQISLDFGYSSPSPATSSSSLKIYGFSSAESSTPCSRHIHLRAQPIPRRPWRRTKSSFLPTSASCPDPLEFCPC